LVFDTIRRRKLSIVVSTLLLHLMGLGIVANIAPHYVATAALMLENRKPALSTLPSQSDMVTSETVAARTQVDLLRAPALAREVVTALDLVHAPEFARQMLPHETWLSRLIGTARRRLRLSPEPLSTGVDEIEVAAALLAGKLNIVNDGRSYVIEIQARTEDPALGPAIANEVARAYLALRTRLKSEALQRASARFDARLSELQSRMRNAQRAVADYRAESGLIEERAASSLSGVTQAGQQLAQLGTQLAAATGERARIEASLSQMRAASRAADYATVPEVVAAPLIQRLHEQEATLSGKEADLAVTRGANDPGLMAVRASKLDVQRKIGAEVTRIIQSLDNAADSARAREAALRANLAALQGQVAGEGRSTVRLMELESEADAARSLYISVLDRVRQTANEADMQEPDAVLVSAAVPAISPAVPTRRQLALLVLVAAPLLSLLIALLRDRLRPGIRSAEAAEALTGLPCLAFAPSRSGRRGARAFAASVAALPSMLGPVRPRVLLLTSSVPGEGTSVLAEALARSIAETGDQVLLVICGPGLTAPVLPQPNLEVITAMPPALPQASRHNYDLIILDTPAVLSSSKTLPLVGVAEATLLVVRYGHTPAPVVSRATRLLRRHRARLAGTVVTRVDTRALSAADGTELFLQRNARLPLARPAIRAR
jgi:uncharacterized protein involved in exopolysaccharide biosynthesis